MTSRIFIALDIPSNELQSILNLRDTIYSSTQTVRWEDVNKLHITLKFLGDIGENVSELLIRRLELISFPKIHSQFEKFSFFKRNGSLRILFAALRESNKLNQLHTLIEDECELVGFEKEKRKFHPHVTILRLKGTEELKSMEIFNNYKIKGSEFVINSFSLYKSELKPTGSEYIKIKSFNLV